MGLVVSKWATCANLTDVTPADEDTNSILTDNANRAIQGNVAMQIIQSDYQDIRICICERNQAGGKICN